jgi:hypothetical protein
MLQPIENLPAEVWGLRAIGKVSRNNYEQVVRPALDQARGEGRRLRFVYHLGPEFEGFTAGGAWEDARVGVQYIRLFERCAVVTDVDWIRTTTRAVAPVLPCPVKVFRNADWNEAIAWASAARESSVDYRILAHRGVLVIEPRRTLRQEDFDALSAAADAWIESTDQPLRGIVVHARTFPGWENLGSFLRHVRFVRDQHRRVDRVALSTDTALAGLASSVVDHFTEATIKRYDYEDFDCAIDWAAGRGETVNTDADERSRLHASH